MRSVRQTIRNRKPAAKPGQLRVGWSSRSITPDRPVSLMGQFYVRISQAVNDPITVTALAIEDHPKGDRAVIVSCDHGLIPDSVMQSVRAKVAATLPSFDPAAIILCAIHTHNAPVFDDFWYPKLGPEVMAPSDYHEFFCEQAAQAVVEAWQRRAPAGVSTAFGHAVVGRNRRLAYLDGSSQMYGQSNRDDFAGWEGGSDSGVDMVFTWNRRRKLTGVVVNLPCPSQVSEHKYFVSADFWHEARTEIRKRLGAGVFVLPLCSAAGDQSPHILVHHRIEKAMQTRTGMELRQQIGARIAAAVAEAYGTARKDIQTTVPFRHARAVLRLPRQMISMAACLAARRAYRKLAADHSLEGRPVADRAASTHFARLKYHQSVINRYKRQRAKVTEPVEVHACRIGDVALATNPFELFLDYGLRIKERSPAQQTLVVQLACGGKGYLPTQRAVDGGSYGASAQDLVIGPAGGQEMVNRTLKLIARIWK